MFGLNNKKILLTGAAGFLGQALNRALMAEGAEVVGTDVEETPLVRKLNISDPDDVERFARNLQSEGIELDGLINNAAVSFKGREITSDEFSNTLKVNIQGTHNCITRFYSILQRQASIVNIASVYGFLSSDYRTYENNEDLFSSSAYGASKAAVIQLTKYYAVHYAGEHSKDGVSWGRSIRVNSVSPGGIWQNHNEEFMENYGSKVPMGRMAQVDEIVQPIMFLLSPKSSYINGHNLVVDGGMSAW